MKKLTDYLEELGLSELEAKLYEGLLETGPTSVMGLAEHVGINRITTHFNLRNLIEKGLVIETRKGTRRHILPEPPERLKYLVDQKLEETEKLKQNFPNILQTINLAFPKIEKKENIEIRYYKGKKGVMNIYNETLKAKEFRSYVNCSKLHHAFPGNIRLFLETHKERKDMVMWEIMENSIATRRFLKLIPKERYYYRIIPENLDLSLIDYMIFDGKVAIIDLTEDISGIMISNINYYNNAKAIFKLVWQVLS